MIEIHKSKDGKFYFLIKAKNGKVLTTSETYTRKRSCLDGADALISMFYDSLHSVKNIVVDKTLQPE